MSTIYPPSMLFKAKEPEFFEKISYDKAKRITYYRFNVKKLSKDECHIFWDHTQIHARLIACFLEFSIFHPLTKMNEKFNIIPIECNHSHIFMCSFPKKFKPQCEKAAQLYNMHVKNLSATLIDEEYQEDRIDSSLALTLSDEKWTHAKKQVEKEKPIAKDALKEFIKKHPHYNIIEFPKSDNVLWIEGNSLSKKRLKELEQEVISIGNVLHKLGVD